MMSQRKSQLDRSPLAESWRERSRSSRSSPCRSCSALATAAADVPPSGATGLAVSAKVEVSLAAGLRAPPATQVLRGTSCRHDHDHRRRRHHRHDLHGHHGREQHDLLLRASARRRRHVDRCRTSPSALPPRGDVHDRATTIVKENCFPGTTAWKVTQPAQASTAGSRATRPRRASTPGGSLDLKVNAADRRALPGRDLPQRLLRRNQGRLISTIPGLTGLAADAARDDSTPA